MVSSMKLPRGLVDGLHPVGNSLLTTGQFCLELTHTDDDDDDNDDDEGGEGGGRRKGETATATIVNIY